MKHQKKYGPALWVKMKRGQSPASQGSALFKSGTNSETSRQSKSFATQRSSVPRIAAGLLAGMGKWIVILLLSAFTATAQTGGAYFYGDECAGRTMANNHIFNPEAMTCASWFHPMGSVLLVTRTDVNPTVSVVVTVTDRGPARRLVRTQNRVIDLSESAFKKIGDTRLGHVRVTVTRKRI